MRVGLAMTTLLAWLGWFGLAHADDAGQRILVQQFVAALQGKSAAQMTSLLHPKVRSCMNGANKAYFDRLVASFENVPPAKYTVSIKPLSGRPVLFGLPPEHFRYPVTPTHQFEIGWSPKENSFVSVVRQIAFDNGKWSVVYPCPDAEGIKFVNEQLEAGRDHKARVQALVTGLRPSLRTELIAMLKQGRKMDAIKKVEAEKHVDLTTAVQVIDRLAEP